MQGGRPSLGGKPRAQQPQCGASVTVCPGIGLHSWEDTAPDIWVRKETAVFIFFRKKKKKKHLEVFFFLKALSFRRNLDMLLFKKKSVCNVSVTRFVLSMIYVRKWFF